VAVDPPLIMVVPASPGKSFRSDFFKLFGEVIPALRVPSGLGV